MLFLVNLVIDVRTNARFVRSELYACEGTRNRCQQPVYIVRIVQVDYSGIAGAKDALPTIRATSALPASQQRNSDHQGHMTFMVDARPYATLGADVFVSSIKVATSHSIIKVSTTHDACSAQENDDTFHIHEFAVL